MKEALNYKKPAFWLIAASWFVCAIVAICFLERPKDKENSYGETQLYYIEGGDNDSLFLDDIEWVADAERAAELGLQDKTPSGFFIYNEDETSVRYPFAEECTFTILEWIDGMVQVDVDKQTFLEMIDGEAFLPPYYVTIVDGKIAGIIEQYVP